MLYQTKKTTLLSFLCIVLSLFTQFTNINAQSGVDYEQRAEAVARQADAASNSGNCKRAIELYRKATQLFESAGKEYSQENRTTMASNAFARAASCSSNAGVCFSRMENFQKAYIAHKKAEELYRRAGLTRMADTEKALADTAQENLPEEERLVPATGLVTDLLPPDQRGEARDRGREAQPNNGGDNGDSRDEEPRKEERACQCEDLSYTLVLNKLDDSGNKIEEETISYHTRLSDGDDRNRGRDDDNSRTIEKYKPSPGTYLHVQIRDIDFNCSCSGEEGCNNIAERRMGNSFTGRGRPIISLGSPSGINDNANCQATSQGTMRIGRQRHSLGWNDEMTEFNLVMYFEDENLNGIRNPYQFIEVKGHCYDENCGNGRDNFTFCSNRLKLEFEWAE